MSYILDALKKSENERQNQDLPDLNAIHQRPQIQPAQKRAFWPAVIIVVITLNIGGFWYLSANAPAINSSAVTAPEDTPKANQIEIATPALDLESQQAMTSSATQNQVLEVPRLEIEELKTELLITPSDAYRSNTSQDSGAISQSLQPERNRVVSKITALPTNIQRQIPDLRFSSHLYADDSSFRMVNINGNVFHEGDIIAEGIRLRQISEEGVILNYLHYTFEISVIRDWSFR